VDDKLKLSRAARSLALALSTDNELASSRIANERFRLSLADGMHQVRSPLQAFRTFGKLLQRQLAEGDDGEMEQRAPPASSIATSHSARGGDDGGGGGGRRRQQQWAMKLAEDILSQGERVIDLIEPMDALIRNDVGRGKKYLLLGDVKERVVLLPPLLPPSWDDPAVAGTATTAQIVPYRRYDQLPPPMPVLGELYAYQAISLEAGIKLDAVGFEPDNPDLPGVKVCTRHLTEAVSNLLDNAVKYAPLRRGGGRKQGKKLVSRPRIPQIRVMLVSIEPPLSPGATLYIEDNGPGIPTSERDEVFVRRYRGRAVVDEVEGSGLGLAIAREMVTRMGGVLDIVDEGPNRLNGTTVRVILFRDPEI
jgi:signal transduction histidine kinase